MDVQKRKFLTLLGSCDYTKLIWYETLGMEISCMLSLLQKVRALSFFPCHLTSSYGKNLAVTPSRTKRQRPDGEWVKIFETKTLLGEYTRLICASNGRRT